MVKNLPAMWETQIRLWVRKIPWRREWQPTPVSLPGKCHGQRSLAGYSTWGHKESDMSEEPQKHVIYLFLVLSVFIHCTPNTHTHRHTQIATQWGQWFVCLAYCWYNQCLKWCLVPWTCSVDVCEINQKPRERTQRVSALFLLSQPHWQWGPSVSFVD